ncbi:hypothetical protein CSAL01_13091 [Colletotrichum salicis]|uniref:Uncharacterized protein n=1 Tax=Colletotrichum salicis TaxID=1209931 RepID=A0A135V4L8_9PEZI|nr:hypothetical protein CSAL01_13091 [Colletotrichum salicis]
MSEIDHLTINSSQGRSSCDDEILCAGSDSADDNRSETEALPPSSQPPTPMPPPPLPTNLRRRRRTPSPIETDESAEESAEETDDEASPTPTPSWARAAAAKSAELHVSRASEQAPESNWYDNKTGIIETSEESWDHFNQRFPYLKGISRKGFPYMDEMALLWPNEVATGEFIREADDANIPMELSNEERSVSGRRQQKKRKQQQPDFDPDINTIASESPPEISSAIATPKKLYRLAAERLQAFGLLRSSIEKGLGSLRPPPPPPPLVLVAAPRLAGSDDIISASTDFQLLFGERLGGRAVAKMGRLFAAAPLDARGLE